MQNLDDLTNDEFAALMTEARAPTTPPQRLEAIFHQWQYPREETRRHRRLMNAFAAHPNMPPDCLIWLSAISPEALVRNPALPLVALERPDFAEQIVGRHDKWPLLRMLRFETVPMFILREAKRSHSRVIQHEVRWHIGVAGEADPTATDWETQALKALRRLPKTRWERVWEIVEHQAAPVGLMERLGLAAVHPPEHHYTAWFRKQQERAARRLERRKGLSEPAATGGSPDSSDWQSYYRRRQIASDPTVSPDDLRTLALSILRDRQPHTILIRALASNPATPADLLPPLLPDAADIVALHPNTSSDLLREIAASYAVTVAVWSALLANPGTPSDVMERCIQYLWEASEFDQKLGAYERRLLRWHPLLNPEGPRLPEETGEPFRQWLTAYRPRLDSFLWTVGRDYSPGRLSRIARWHDWSRRLAVALNASVPPATLRNLCRDGNRFVRAAAQARLSFPNRPLLGISYNKPG